MPPIFCKQPGAIRERRCAGWGRRLLAAAGVIIAVAALAPGQAADPFAGQTVQSVRIEGNRAVPAATILTNVRTRANAVFNEQLVSEDARRILLMPQINDVEWRVSAVPGGVEVVFQVLEAPRIGELTIVGNQSISTEELQRQLRFGAGDFMDRYLVNLGAETIAQHYRDKGYYFAHVRVSARGLDENNVVYVVVEGPRLRIRRVSFEGNESFPDYRLRTKIVTKAYFPIFARGRLDDEQLERDARSLAGYYHGEGFLDARVFARKSFNEEQTRAEVAFVIEEGPRYTIAAISFVGHEHFDEAELRAELGDFEAGQPFTLHRRTAAQRALTRLYGADGYIYTRVNIQREFTEEPGEVNAVFRIDEGISYNLGRLLVRGNTITRDRVVRREFSRVGFLPGGLYDGAAVERARRRLLGYGLFQSVDVMPIGDMPEQRDALVEVEEAQTGMLLMGVGVDTNSGVVGQFTIEQRNFDLSRPPHSLRDLFSGRALVGGGQRMRLDFEPGTKVTRGRLNFHEPYLFDQPNYLDLSLFLFRRWRESYLERRRGGIVTLGRRFENDWSVEVGLRGELIKVSDLDIERLDPLDPTSPLIVASPQDVIDVEGSNVLSSVRFGVGRDTTDSFFRPTEGYKFNNSYEQVGVPGGDFTFGAITSTLVGYHTLYTDILERKTVLAGRVEGRHILGDAPVFERYYAGGIGSIRGFDYRGVSPRAGRNNDPVGSDFIILAGAEISHPIFQENFFGKLFCDTGIVDEGPYRVTLGFGFKILVPQLLQMVPMHFDFGFPIYFDDRDDKQVFSFSFGVSF